MTTLRNPCWTGLIKVCVKEKTLGLMATAGLRENPNMTGRCRGLKRAKGR